MFTLIYKALQDLIYIASLILLCGVKCRSFSHAWFLAIPWSVHGVFQARILEWVAIPFFFFFTLFYFTILYWFCHTLTWIRHGCTWVPKHEPPLPPPTPYHFSGSSPCTSPKHPVSCIEHRLAIHFLHDSIHVSVPFSQIIPPSPSPTESKSPFYTSVSLLLSRIQGHHYHLSKFIAALFIIARTWKQPRCPSADEWMRKLWYIYKMEYYSAIKKNTFESVLMRWMKLEPIIQSEVSQKEKHQYSILTHIYGI